MLTMYQKLIRCICLSRLVTMSVLIIPSLMQAEFLICRLNQSNYKSKEAIFYAKMSENDRLNLHDLYQKTVYRYQFPTVKKFYQQFSPEEKKSYVAALHKKNGGLFEFIKQKVETISNKQYSLFWVPTTVFEIYGLYFSLGLYAFSCDKNDENYCSLIPLATRNIFKLWLPNFFDNGLNRQYLEVDFSLRNSDLKLYFITVDYVLQEYQQQGKLIEVVKASNIDYIMKLLYKKLIHLKNSHSNYNQRSIFIDQFLTIIQQVLFLDQEAYKNNQFLLFRGTNGCDDRFDKISPGKTGGWSYAYSLFAGTLFERFGFGARTLDFMTEMDMGYVLCINICDLFEKDIFDISDRKKPQEHKFFIWLPNITTLQGLFGWGEYFHPRLWSSKFYDTNNNVVAYWLSCLSKAVVVQNNSSQNQDKQDLLQKEIGMQKRAMLNSVLQQIDNLFVQEADEFQALLNMMHEI